MPTTGRPGVYVTENFSPLVTNTAVPGEALPAIVALHPQGPTAPTLIQSWNQYVQYYGSFAQASILPYSVYEFFNNGGTQLYVLRLANSDATSASLTLDDIATTPAGALLVTSLSPGVWGQSIYIEVVVRTGRQGFFDFNVYVGGNSPTSLAETFPDMTMNPLDPRYCVAMLNSPSTGSKYVNVEDLVNGDAIPVGSEPNVYVPGQTDLAHSAPQGLTGGSDGSIPPVLSTVIPQWLDTLLDQALIINVPGLVDVPTINNLLTWCANDADKFLVIDGPAPDPAGLSASGYSTRCVNEYLNMVNSGSPNITASAYAAMYAPWVLAQDPSSSVPGAARWLPPGPFVLGQFNATDISRGTFVTPAGTKNRLKLLSLETQFSQSNLDSLNNAQVNTIKMVPGVGYCLFGGRTLHPGYPDRYISVRRMIIQLEHDFKWMLQGFLFESNDYLLWRQITATLNNYLTQQLQLGALGGSTPAETFSVVCDSSNNTASLAAAGIVTVDIAVALLSPAEYINITLSQFQGSGVTTVTTTT